MKNLFLVMGFFFSILFLSPLQGQTPLFSFTDTSVCQGETVLFENLYPDLCGYEYQWDFGDGSVDTTRGKNVWHTYSQAGTYNASMIMTNDNYIYILQSITVIAIPANWINFPFDLKPDIYFRFKDLDCDELGFSTPRSSSNLTLPHTFTFNKQLGRRSFEVGVWDYDASLLDDKIGEFPLDMSAGSGSYTKQYVLGDLIVSWIIDSIPIIVQPQTVVVEPGPTVPVIQSTSSFKVCGGSLTLFASSDPGIALQWYKDGVAIPNANGDTLITTETGIYVVEAINPVGCSPTSPEELIVIGGGALSPVLVRDLGVANPRKYICVKGNSVIYGPELYGGRAKDGSDYSHPDHTFTWYKDGVVQSNTGLYSNFFTPSQAGNYWVVVSDTAGCYGTSDTMFISTHVETPPEISPQDTAYFCGQGSLFLHTNTSQWLKYQWYKDDQPIPDSLGGQNPTLEVFEAGTYSIIHDDSAGCFLPVHISNAPYVDVIDTDGMPYKTAIRIEGDSLIALPAASYQWLEANTQQVLSTDFFFIPVQSGDYYVSIVDTNGCEAISDIVHFNFTSLESQMPQFYAKIFPNPSNGIFYLSLDLTPQGKGFLSVWNINGSHILNSEITDAQTELNFSAFSDGIFLINIYIEGYEPISRKLIIQH